MRENQKTFWKSCTTGVPGLDAHLDAYTNVRDADALRQALGLRRINIHGFSYGTLSAERYLAKYGRHVNGSILEGVMNPPRAVGSSSPPRQRACRRSSTASPGGAPKRQNARCTRKTRLRCSEKPSRTPTQAVAGGRTPLPDEPGEEFPERVPYADPIVCQDFTLNVGSVEEAGLDLAATKKAAPVVGFSTNASNYASICLGGPKLAPNSSAEGSTIR